MAIVQKTNGAYTIKSGDTLSKIASNNGVTLADLLASNPQYQANPNAIQPGQTVNFGASSPSLANLTANSNDNPQAFGPNPVPAPHVGIATTPLKKVVNSPDGTVTHEYHGPVTGSLPNVIPQPTAPTSSFPEVLTQMLKDSQSTFRGNSDALMKGQENIDQTNSDVYSNDFKNANLSNSARLALLGNDQGLQAPGLKSIEHQQTANQNNLDTTSNLVKLSLDNYNKEQDRINQAKADLADAEYKNNLLAETIRSHKADESTALQKITPNTPTAPNQYEIQSGDTLKKLADANGLTVDALRTANPGINENNLQVGQKINLSNPADAVGNYSTLDIGRYGRAANAIVKNFIALPQYQLTANGLPYLQRIKAADSTPGSVSDAELLDSIVKINTGGNQVTEAQVKLITGGRSLADTLSVWGNKLNNGGQLGDKQRADLTKLADTVFENYKKGYQPVYDQATKQMRAAGIPEAFWNIPDLNTLSTKAGQGMASETDQSGGGDYENYLKAIQ